MRLIPAFAFACEIVGQRPNVRGYMEVLLVVTWDHGNPPKSAKAMVMEGLRWAPEMCPME